MSEVVIKNAKLLDNNTTLINLGRNIQTTQISFFELDGSNQRINIGSNFSNSVKIQLCVVYDFNLPDGTKINQQEIPIFKDLTSYIEYEKEGMDVFVKDIHRDQEVFVKLIGTLPVNHKIAISYK